MAAAVLLVLGVSLAHGRLLRQELDMGVFVPRNAPLPQVRQYADTAAAGGGSGANASAAAAAADTALWRNASASAGVAGARAPPHQDGLPTRAAAAVAAARRRLVQVSPGHPSSPLYAGAATHTMTAATPLAAVASTSRGGSHYLRLMSDGTVASEGRGAEGQLGHGDFADVAPPGRRILGLYDVVQVSAGGRHSLLLMRDGTVVSFGNGRAGQLGHGADNYNLHDTPHMTEPNADLAFPHRIIFLTNVKAVAAGGSHSVLLMADGTVRTCGLGLYGALGHGADTGNVNIPKPVAGVSGVLGVRAALLSTTLLLPGGVPRLLSFLGPPALAHAAVAAQAGRVKMPRRTGPLRSPAAPAGPSLSYALPPDRTNVVGNAPQAGCCDAANSPLSDNPMGQLLATLPYAPANPVVVDAVQDADRALLRAWERAPANASRLVPRAFCDFELFYYDPATSWRYPTGRGRFPTGELLGEQPAFARNWTAVANLSLALERNFSAAMPGACYNSSAHRPLPSAADLLAPFKWAQPYWLAKGVRGLARRRLLEAAARPGQNVFALYRAAAAAAAGGVRSP
jgi:hypothetical protein